MRRFSRQFQSCFERIRDPLLIVDADGTIRGTNPAARASLDFREHGRISDVTWLDRKVAFDGGSIMPLLRDSAPVLGRRLNDPEGNETDVVIDIIDLSGKKHGAGPKLIHIKDYASYTHYERWKDELLSMVAHEIKNPLAAMKTSINVLVSHAAEEMTDGQRKLLGVSLRNIDRLTRLLDNVLDVSRFRSGGYTPEPRWVSAPEFTAEVIEAFKTLFNVERQRLSYSVSDAVDRVYVDAPKLEQILVNLLTNAVKFTQEGGEVTVRVDRAGLEALGEDLRILPWGDVADMKFVRFTVTDTGIGMTEEMLSHLFTRYHRDKGRSRHKGSHLGLSISKALVEVQNGTIEFESELGVGTTVTVALPADEATVTLLARLRSIDRARGRLVGVWRRVTCLALRKEPSSSWDRVGELLAADAVLNPTIDDEKTGTAFLWALTDRLGLALVAEDARGGMHQNQSPSSREFEGCAFAARTLTPEDARLGRLLGFAFKNLEVENEVRRTE